MKRAKGITMQQENRNRQTVGRVKAGGMIVAAYIVGTSGGLFLYPYLSYQALIGFGLLIVGNLILIFFATRPNRAA